jgi:hypothetical protein
LITPGLIQVNSITTTHLAFTPATSTNVIATINASAEGIDITADRISISGTTTFSAGYDPSTKCPTASCIANGGAAADVNANTTVITGGKITVNGSSTFGSGYDPTGKIPLTGAAADVNANVTTIDGGHITTNSITASQIAANTITASQIAAGAITATEISVSSLDAISANMGTIMAGSIYLVGSYGSITIDGNSGGIYGDVVGAQSLYVSSAQITSLIVPGLGGGNGYVCVGSSGNLYRATSCP